MTKPASDFFTKELAERYDERNRKLMAISDCLHFLISLVLKKLPPKAQILSVGAGTGAEILALAEIYPGWTFVAIEPSLSMLEVCKERLKAAGILGRCELVHGYVHEYPDTAQFDAVLSILVAHFIKPEARKNFYSDLLKRVKPQGFLINAEISFDLGSNEFPSMLEHWGAVQTLMGATPESLSTLPQTLKEVLTVFPPEKTEGLLKEIGVQDPVRFFQALMISGWYGTK